MKAHPIAEVFPILDGSHLEQLAESIKTAGQQHAIVVLDGAILDGRCRAAACKLAGVEPKTCQYRGKKDTASLVAYVEAANKHRRHLSPSQLAVSAVKLSRISEANAGQICPVTQKAAAESLGVSERTVKSAAKVIDHAAAPVIKAVEAGEIKVSDAAAVAELPKAEQTAALKAVKKGEAKTLRAAAESVCEATTAEDAVGRELPAALVSVFEVVDEFEEQSKALAKIKKWAEQVAATVPGSYLHAQSFIGQLTAAQKQLKFERPYAVCPYCLAAKKKCEACKGRGFVTKPIYDGAPSEMRV